MLTDNNQLRTPMSDLVFAIRKIKNQKKWTKEEDEELIQLAEKYSEKNWKEISKRFIKKNSLQCFSRYKRIRPGIIKGSWKKDEDLQIIDLVNQYGKSWSKISKLLGTRNGKQIRDRYINVLDPEIRKGKFTEDEDSTLIQLYHEHGPKWATISKYYPNRTADMVKNRFHSSIKKRLGIECSEYSAKIYQRDITPVQPMKKTEYNESSSALDKVSTASAQTLPKTEPKAEEQLLDNDLLFQEVKEGKNNENEEANYNNVFNWNYDMIQNDIVMDNQDELDWNFDAFIYN